LIPSLKGFWQMILIGTRNQGYYEVKLEIITQWA